MLTWALANRSLRASPRPIDWRILGGYVGCGIVAEAWDE